MEGQEVPLAKELPPTPFSAMDLAGLAWPLSFAAFGAAMFSVCTYRRNRVRGMAVAALEQAYETMLSIEKGDLSRIHGGPDTGPFAEQLGTIRSIGHHLAARSRHLSAIIEAQPECVRVVDSEGRLVHMNPAGLRMISASSMAKVRGAEIINLIVEEHREAYLEMHADVLQGNHRTMTFEAIGLNGDRLWLETSAVPLADSSGNIVHLAVTRDVTERKRQEAVVREATARAESANRSKSVFLANMSHELRTPLTAIIGYSDLLSDSTGVEESHKPALEAIQGSAEHLLALINDVLDVSKIEAGHLEVETIPFDLRDLVQRTMQSLRQGVMEAGLTLKLTWDEGTPRMVESDPTRIRQVLTNLLSNATKFTTEGGIHVRVSAGPRHPQTAKLDFAIAVSDTGIGIRKSALERVFSPFQQAEASTSRQFGGTGLGLTISREIAAEMGGDLSVESTVGAGACFTLSLPLKISDAEIEGSPRREEESTIEGRVLVVEDNAINRRVLSELLTRRGLEVETAIDGLDGSRRATGHHEPEDAFDLIFMDMQMPVQDGYAATRELRAKGLTIPIIALTASAMAEDRRRCTDAGCNAHLAKPIDNVLLDELLSQYLGRVSPE